MSVKALFEVAVRTDEDPQAPYKILYVLANDEVDLFTVEGVRQVKVAGVHKVGRRVTATGPSRIIGHTWGPERSPCNAGPRSAEQGPRLKPGQQGSAGHPLSSASASGVPAAAASKP